MNPINPFQPDSLMNKSFMGRSLLQGFVNEKKKKPASYGKMKMKQIAKRRKRNKMAARSRRVNRIRKELSQGTKRQPKKKTNVSS